MVRSTSSKSGSGLRQDLQSRRFRLREVKDGQKSRHLKVAFDARRHIHYHHAALVLFHKQMCADKLPDPGAVNGIRQLKIYEELPIANGEEMLNPLDQ